MSYRDIVNADLEADEGRRRFPYKDSLGILTIGVGINLDDGLRDEEINYIRDNRVSLAEIDARHLFKNFDELSDRRKAVVVNMAYNMGYERLSRFHRMREAVEAGNFTLAEIEMRDSAWANQVQKSRVDRLCAMMKEG